MNRRSLIKMLSGLSVLPLLPNVTLANTTHRRVILLELAGANDGLNTVVPYNDDRYHELRPRIGLKSDKIITHDDQLAFNHAMKDAMPLWEHGDMAVVHGLGYPNPNRSHFKSIVLWETGSDGNNIKRNGWITHDIEHAYAISNIDAHGISLGGGMGVFAGAKGNWLSMSTADQYSDRTINSNAINESQNSADKNTLMKLLLERSKTLNSSIDQIAKKVENNKHRVPIKGADPFNAQVTHAINLINSGVDTPVLKIRLDGFDTHEDQIGRHQRLLTNLSEGVSRLRTELSKTDNWNNTVIVTYSEFGRRASENRSNGTDHGTASAHFIFGGNINGGFHGQHPNLGQLVDGDLQYTTDYRALYSNIVSDWLRLPSNQFKMYSDPNLSSLFG